MNDFLSFFFNDPSSTEIYTLSLHDALPIFAVAAVATIQNVPQLMDQDIVEIEVADGRLGPLQFPLSVGRSEEHTSELQSLTNIVCRLLLEKKNIRHIQDSSDPL